MKESVSLAILIFALSLTVPTLSFAQGMMGNSLGENGTVVQNSNHNTLQEEQEGKEIWEKLQAKETTCDKLSDEDFASLGEYFMGQMAGSSHESMNNMMVQMMGNKGEEQMHIVMGKRLSRYDTNAQIPQNGLGFMPMMWMVGAGLNPAMNFGFAPLGWFGWLFMIIFWILVIIGIIALIKWLLSQSKNRTKEQSALEILKMRYAKGKISKKEFKEKKKDLL